MTVYAIVNHLTGTKSRSESEEPEWTIISGAGILQGGNPYFVPDFACRFEARAAIAVRIGRLGKGIARRFAYRYADAMAPCVLFVASELIDSLRMKGLPWTRAISYDRSLAIGKFRPIDGIIPEECRMRLEIKGDRIENVQEIKGDEITPALDVTINALSRDNTLKTGDIIILGLKDHGPEVTPGQRAQLSLDGEISPGFNIR